MSRLLTRIAGKWCEWRMLYWDRRAQVAKIKRYYWWQRLCVVSPHVPVVHPIPAGKTPAQSTQEGPRS